jgi:superfamily I DNA/RNA helicase
LASFAEYGRNQGLEFPAVVIPGAGYLPCLYEAPDDEAKLLYVALTRALNQLVVTYHQESPTSQRLQTALLRFAC